MKTQLTITLFFVAFISFNSKVYATELSKTEKEGIQLMREEEKLAHDVYVYLYKKWNLRIFSNISNAESRHFDAVGYLIGNYKLKDNATKQPGNFNNKKLQDLYDSLTEKGSESLTAALEVGALIEEVDIADLQKLLAAKPDSVIAGVYQNLLRGSENHLRAFTGQLESRDAKYIPTVLSEADYNNILAGTHQKGDPKNCVLPGDNCQNKQNRGKGGKRGCRGWNN